MNLQFRQATESERARGEHRDKLVYPKVGAYRLIGFSMEGSDPIARLEIEGYGEIKCTFWRLNRMRAFYHGSPEGNYLNEIKWALLSLRNLKNCPNSGRAWAEAGFKECITDLACMPTTT